MHQLSLLVIFVGCALCQATHELTGNQTVLLRENGTSVIYNCTDISSNYLEFRISETCSEKSCDSQGTNPKTLNITVYSINCSGTEIKCLALNEDGTIRHIIGPVFLFLQGMLDVVSDLNITEENGTFFAVWEEPPTLDLTEPDIITYSVEIFSNVNGSLLLTRNRLIETKYQLPFDPCNVTIVITPHNGAGRGEATNISRSCLPSPGQDSNTTSDEPSTVATTDKAPGDDVGVIIGAFLIIGGVVFTLIGVVVWFKCCHKNSRKNKHSHKFHRLPERPTTRSNDITRLPLDWNDKVTDSVQLTVPLPPENSQTSVVDKAGQPSTAVSEDVTPSPLMKVLGESPQLPDVAEADTPKGKIQSTLSDETDAHISEQMPPYDQLPVIKLKDPVPEESSPQNQTEAMILPRIRMKDPDTPDLEVSPSDLLTKATNEESAPIVPKEDLEIAVSESTNEGAVNSEFTRKSSNPELSLHENKMMMSHDAKSEYKSEYGDSDNIQLMTQVKQEGKWHQPGAPNASRQPRADRTRRNHRGEDEMASSQAVSNANGLFSFPWLAESSQISCGVLPNGQQQQPPLLVDPAVHKPQETPSLVRDSTSGEQEETIPHDGQEETHTHDGQGETGTHDGQVETVPHNGQGETGTRDGQGETVPHNGQGETGTRDGQGETDGDDKPLEDTTETTTAHSESD